MKTNLDELRRAHGPGERRTLTARVTWTPEGRDDASSLRLRGRAALFNTPARIGDQFVEELAPGCFTRSLNRSGEAVALLWQHDTRQPLARVSNQTLTLDERGDGLHFAADVVPTSYGQDAVTAVRSGLVDELSFGFICKRDEWTQRAAGLPHRRVLEAELLEVSLVTWPAYQGTSAETDARDLGRAVIEARQKLARIGSPNQRGPLKVRERTPYGADSPHSWFRDLLVAGEADRMRQASHSRGEPADLLGQYGSILGSRGETGEHGGVPEARDRLARLAEAELRDASTNSTAGGGFILTGAPAYLAAEFATAARAKAVLPGLLRVEPLPAAGMVVDTGRISSAATAEAQAGDNQAISETDLAEADASSPVGTIAGVQDASLQLFERSAPGMDIVLARELAAAIATALDAQVINGTGTAGQLQGLLDLTGRTTGAYTNATPAQAEMWAALLSLVASYTTNLGAMPTAVILHGRRLAWLLNWQATTGGLVRPSLPGVQLVACQSIPVSLSTDQDAVIVLRGDETPLYVGPVVIEVFRQVGSLAGTVRVRAYQYAASGATRRPEAVGVLTGSGLSTPAFT